MGVTPSSVAYTTTGAIMGENYTHSHYDMAYGFQYETTADPYDALGVDSMETTTAALVEEES